LLQADVNVSAAMAAAMASFIQLPLIRLTQAPCPKRREHILVPCAVKGAPGSGKTAAR
jgi:hypothetical protein